jgi:hypothetical protein
VSGVEKLQADEKSVLESFQEASASWEQVVFCAVEKSLLDLGPSVYSIEWANKYEYAVA